MIRRKKIQAVVLISMFSSLALATTPKNSTSSSQEQMHKQFVVNMQMQQKLMKERKLNELASHRIELNNLQVEQVEIENQKKSSGVANPLAFAKLLSRSQSIARKIEMRKKQISSLENELGPIR